MIIREMKESDIAFMLEVRNDETTYVNLHTPVKFTYEESINWFRNQIPIWYIIDVDENSVGYIRTSNWNFNNKSMTIGCDIHPQFRKKGYATQAYEILFNLLLKKEWKSVNLKVLKKNNIAFSFYKKLGFKIFKEDDESYYMDRNISNVNVKGKGLKVIVCYFGDRRSNPINAKDGYNLLKFIWNREIELNQEYKYDTCFVINDLSNNDKVTDRLYVDKCTEFINNIAEKETNSGKCFVEHRQNIGLSFGAYDYIFNKYKDNYDYFMFIEDDQVIIKENIFQICLNQLMNPLDIKNIGFVATVGVNREWGPAAHGGCGVTSYQVLNHVSSTHFNPILNRGSLYFYDGSRKSVQMIYEDLWNGEVMFTKSINDLGYYLEDIKVKNLIVSWQDYNKRNEKLISFEPWMSNLDMDKNSFPRFDISKLYGGWLVGEISISINHLNCSRPNHLWGRLNYLDNKFSIIWENNDIYYLSINYDELDKTEFDVECNDGSKQIKKMKRIC
jgi:RimJ/RimL family protein N-acetyltransferase